MKIYFQRSCHTESSLGLPNIFGGPGLFSGQNLRDFTANQANNTGGPGLFSGQNLRDFTANQANNTSTSKGPSTVTGHTRIPSSP